MFKPEDGFPAPDEEAGEYRPSGVVIKYDPRDDTVLPRPYCGEPDPYCSGFFGIGSTDGGSGDWDGVTGGKELQ